MGRLDPPALFLQIALTIHLTEPAWEAPGSSTPRRAEPMDAWDVAAVASWLESCDMAGPAAALKAQGVSGADLLAWPSEVELARDLSTTAHVARKVIRLRDEHVVAQM